MDSAMTGVDHLFPWKCTKSETGGWLNMVGIFSVEDSHVPASGEGI